MRPGEPERSTAARNRGRSPVYSAERRAGATRRKRHGTRAKRQYKKTKPRRAGRGFVQSSGGEPRGFHPPYRATIRHTAIRSVIPRYESTIPRYDPSYRDTNPPYRDTNPSYRDYRVTIRHTAIRIRHTAIRIHHTAIRIHHTAIRIRHTAIPPYRHTIRHTAIDQAPAQRIAA
jgi:hypothetical protein